jgi:Ala-tRNA(Pro) deacylase
MPLKKLMDFLNDHHVKYTRITHSPAMTAQETAACAHFPGKEMAKTVMIKIDGKMAMAVLPATQHVDIELFKALACTENVELAREQDFKNLFPECETGAMPPFGNLYGMDVYVEKDLAQDKQICFNAGSHTELVRMSYKDFEKLVRPRRATFSADRYRI